MRYFTEKEINNASYGCLNGFERMNEAALDMFDQLRHACGFPLTPTCMFRTSRWDLEKGRSGNSKHTEGLAADFACDDAQKRAVIAREAFRLGFSGIGIHKDFVHVDCREGAAVMWLY